MAVPTQRILDAVRAADRSRRTGEVLWRMRSLDGAVDVTSGDPARPFFIASATKVFVTAILAQLRAERLVDWDAPLAGYVPHLDLTGLVVVDGRDHGATMTVREVMSHTAGLPDYFEGRGPGPTVLERVRSADFGWTVTDVLTWARAMKPATPGRAHYSDTGYQLLGAAIEHITGSTFAEVVRARVAGPLGLTGTFCFGPADLGRFDDIAAICDGDRPLRIPLAMASMQADGGIVSTLEDGLEFLEAFFGGRLFDPAVLAEIQHTWRRIFFPLEYGTGIMRFRLPRVMTALRPVPALVGHAGASGAVLFHCPATGLSVVGTVNQVRHRSLPYRLLARTAVAARLRPGRTPG